MNFNLRAGIKAVTPPVLFDALRRMRKSVVSFSGSYETWEVASANATGYDSEQILARVELATQKVESGEAAFERDSVAFPEIEYSWPLLASLLSVALEAGTLRVIDFGGSLGSSWRQNKRYLSRLRIPVSWRVVEQENFVALGRLRFGNETLGFSETITDAARDGVDVVLFSSSLCYVEDPWSFVEEARCAGARFIIVDRLPLIGGTTDRISLQRVSESIYPASYPIRLFGAETVLSSLFAHWRLIERWDSHLQPDEASRCHGFFLERI